MVQDFLSEVIVMKKFQHPNVMKLLGVTVHENKPCIILPLMKMDLKQYLKQNRQVRSVYQIPKTEPHGACSYFRGNQTTGNQNAATEMQ